MAVVPNYGGCPEVYAKVTNDFTLERDWGAAHVSFEQHVHDFQRFSAGI